MNLAGNLETASTRPLGDAVDEQVDDGLRSRGGVLDAPTGKVAVDVHAGKAVDQRPAGDLHQLEVTRTQLPPGKGLGQGRFNQADDFGVVPGYIAGGGMVEISASGNHLEMRRI